MFNLNHEINEGEAGSSCSMYGEKKYAHRILVEMSVEGSCEDDIELFGSRKCSEILDRMSYWQLIWNDAPPGTQLLDYHLLGQLCISHCSCSCLISVHS